ncbi:competence protein ComK [Heyndrickxia sp. NPDC080065]|uniref:competence protein ComK n=1 Tax=Heyndrickxia sp. NPDC080065 TaxID=3390568 RepID=UPI003D04A1C4
MSEKERMIEEYEISPYTMAILPITYGSKLYSEIWELENRFISPFKPLDIVKKSCEYFGSSYEGRRNGTRRLIGVTHKAPIMLDSYTSSFLIPTTSPMNPDCIWLLLNHVHHHEKSSSNNTLVTLRNNQTLEIPISLSSFTNQLQRAAQLRLKYYQHIENMDNKYKRTGFYLNMEASEQKRDYEFKRFFSE